MRTKYLLCCAFIFLSISLFSKVRDPRWQIPDVRKPCTDFTSEEMIGFYPISLKFEYGKMRSTFGEYDFQELNGYHSGAFNETGEITLLSNLINGMTDPLDSVHRPYFQATITGTGDCEGPVKYKVDHSSKVNGNHLYGVKVIYQGYFKSIAIVVRTAQTFNGYYVMWNANIVGGQQQGELHSTSTKYGGVMGQYIMGRGVTTICLRYITNSFYSPINNTLPYNMTTDDLQKAINNGTLKPGTIHVPSLNKPVYVNGQLQTSTTWDNNIYTLKQN